MRGSALSGWGTSFVPTRTCTISTGVVGGIHSLRFRRKQERGPRRWVGAKRVSRSYRQPVDFVWLGGGGMGWGRWTRKDRMPLAGVRGLCKIRFVWRVMVER